MRRHEKEYEIVEPKYSFSYTLTPYGVTASPPRPSFFSAVELRHLAIAVAALTVAFTLVLYNGDTASIPYFLGLAALSVFAGFLIHEMAHKFLARKYGCWAEFRADYRGLAIALLLSIFGFLFAAPGAVYISGNVTREQNGKISLAGPGSNLVIATLCLPFAMLTIEGLPTFVGDVAYSLYFFSTFLAIFNMIPIFPLDGSKVWAWNKPIYIASMAAAVLMFVLAWL